METRGSERRVAAGHSYPSLEGLLDPVHPDPGPPTLDHLGLQGLGDVDPGVRGIPHQKHRHHRPGLRAVSQLEGQAVEPPRAGGTHGQPLQSDLDPGQPGLGLGQGGLCLGQLLRGGAVEHLGQHGAGGVAGGDSLVALGLGSVPRLGGGQLLCEQALYPYQLFLGGGRQALGAGQLRPLGVDTLAPGAAFELGQAGGGLVAGGASLVPLGLQPSGILTQDGLAGADPVALPEQHLYDRLGRLGL